MFIFPWKVVCSFVIIFGFVLKTVSCCITQAELKHSVSLSLTSTLKVFLLQYPDHWDYKCMLLNPQYLFDFFNSRNLHLFFKGNILFFKPQRYNNFSFFSSVNECKKSGILDAKHSLSKRTWECQSMLISTYWSGRNWRWFQIQSVAVAQDIN